MGFTNPLMKAPEKNLPRFTNPLMKAPEKNLPRLTNPVMKAPEKNLPRLTNPVMEAPEKNLPRLTNSVMKAPEKNLPRLTNSVMKTLLDPEMKSLFQQALLKKPRLNKAAKKSPLQMAFMIEERRPPVCRDLLLRINNG